MAVGATFSSYPTRTDSPSTSLYSQFVLAHVFQLVLAVDALVAKNTIQVFALLVFNTLFMVYALVQVRLSLSCSIFNNAN